MDINVKILFDKKYPKMIENLLPHIIKNKINLEQYQDQDIIDEINEWLIINYIFLLFQYNKNKFAKILRIILSTKSLTYIS